MQIKKITAISNIGILEEFSSSDFKQYNLIYGKNGTGKSTLSRIFQEFEIPGVIQGGKCKITYSDKSINLPLQGDSITSNVRVFNSIFVERNLDWNNLAKSVLILSKDKIDETAALEAIKKELPKLNSSLEPLEKSKDAISPRITTALSTIASEIKERFKAFKNRSYPTGYNNYNITNFRRQLSILDTAPTLPFSELDPANFTQHFDVLNTSIGNYDPLQQIKTHDSMASKLLMLEESAKNVNLHGKLKELMQDPILSAWINQGITLHDNKSTCHFCTANLSDERLDNLKNHFDESLSNYIQLVDDTLPHLEALTILSTEFGEGRIVPSLQADFRNAYQHFTNVTSGHQNVINNLIEKLKTSKTTGKYVIDDEDRKVENSILEINEAILQINKVLEKHDLSIESYIQDTANAAAEIERYYVWNWCATTRYYKNLYDYKDLEQKILTINTEITNKSAEVKRLQGLLSTETTGASLINDLLGKFLPHKELSLEFDKKRGGYRIIRDNQDVKGQLSEGEKTAIAFVYFSIKLKEIEEWDKNTIVFIDDPISSLDSHNIHNIFAFISINFGSVPQLFISTHNFHFFKLVRDWLLKKKHSSDKCNVFEMRSIETQGKRRGTLADADESLVTFNSEYNGILKNLLAWGQTENATPTISTATEIANSARKCLESFISFKYCLQDNFRSDLVDNKEFLKHERAEQLLRIYSFVNTFSHKKDQFDTTDMIDSQFVEGYEIAKIVYRLIQSVDPEHFAAHSV